MNEHKITVEPPKIEDREFKKPLLCGPGPCDLLPSVIEALSKPLLSPLCDELFNVVDDIREGLKYAFQTRSKLVLAISGSGNSAMETLVSNLVGPGETMLVAARGIWDERATEMAKRRGIKTVVTKVPVRETFSHKHLEPMLTRLRPAALFITHGDSSTGSVQNLEGLGELCHKYGALLIVDAVVSLGGVPFLMDEWKIDAVYSSTQKAFSGPAGISHVACGPRAEAKINNRKYEPPFYYDLKLLAQQWNCYGNTRSYHHTLSPPMLWALRACLQELCRETLPKMWARHATVTAHFHERIKQIPLEFLVTKPEDRLVTVTTVILPKGYDYKQFVKSLRETHNILIFPGLGPTVDMALRIGLMGVNSTIEIADRVADGIASTLITLRKSSL